MELKTVSDTICAAGGQWNGKIELPLEAEILIPDYLPPVFKIVKSLAKPVILQKEVTTCRLTVGGYLRCILYYQDEIEKKLCKIEQKIPFIRTQELPEGDYTSERIQILGEPEYQNCRAANSRRIELRGAYSLSLCVYARRTCTVVKFIREPDVEQDFLLLQTLENVTAYEKALTLEEDAALSQKPAAVLDIDGAGHIEEVKPLDGKVLVKGSLKMQLCYRSDGAGLITCEERELRFSQLVDVAGAGEDGLYQAWVEVTGSTLSEDGLEGVLLSVTAVLHLNAYKKAEHQIVRDAFSTKNELQLETETLYTEVPEQELDCRIPVICNGTISEPDAQVLACFGEVQPPRVEQTDEGPCLRGNLFVHVMLQNALDEIECYDQTATYKLPCKLQSRQTYRAECQAQVCSLSSKLLGTELTVNAEISVRGLVLRQAAGTAVLRAEAGEPWPQDSHEPALRIYYAHGDETLFEVAKQFHADPEVVAACNHLEEPRFSQAQRILVPGAV